MSSFLVSSKCQRSTQLVLQLSLMLTTSYFKLPPTSYHLHVRRCQLLAAPKDTGSAYFSGRRPTGRAGTAAFKTGRDRRARSCLSFPARASKESSEASTLLWSHGTPERVGEGGDRLAESGATAGDGGSCAAGLEGPATGDMEGEEVGLSVKPADGPWGARATRIHVCPLFSAPTGRRRFQRTSPGSRGPGP